LNSSGGGRGICRPFVCGEPTGRDWLQTATAAIRRNDHRNFLAGAVAGLGAAIAIATMEWFSLASHYPLVVIPFATSIVLVIGLAECGASARAAADRLRCCLAPMDPAPAVAAALAVTAIAPA
jgi:hypothetical protein